MRAVRNLLTAGLLSALSTSAFADVYEASFDGGWFEPTQSGRGAQVDYIPQADGNGSYFIALFTYDNAGNPLWLVLTASGREGTRVFRNVQVSRLQGGSFGNTFTPPNPLGGTAIGTATVDFANCNSLKIDITPSAASGLPPLNVDYKRLGNAAAGNESCPFTTTFSACPTGTTAVAGVERICEIPAGVVTGDLRLNNSAQYVIGGRVAVGNALLATGVVGGAVGNLFIEPGTILRGKEKTSRLIVNPGSKIFAEGTSVAPIVITGPTEVGNATSEGTWGGLIIGGRAPINSNCTGAGSVTCAFEADQALVWGGSLPNDNSGVLSYVQIRSAGGIITGNIDLNALTLGGVGNGTRIDHVQAHNGTDDGFEMFGGNVNMSYIVASGNNDDSIDTDFGYTGKIQYAYVTMDEGSVADSNGIEADNGGPTANFDAAPRSRPQLVNATFDGGNRAFDAIKIRRGSGFVLQNVVAHRFLGSCVNFNDNPTYLAGAPAGQPTALTGALTMSGSFLGCTKNFDDVAADPWLISAWYNGQANNAIGDVAAALINGRVPTATSPLRAGATVNSDAFFDASNSKGAFENADWTKGWTTGL